MIRVKLLTSKQNLNHAYLQVYRNKGAGGVDGIQVDALGDLLKRKGTQYTTQIEQGRYVTQPILGVELERSGNHEYH